MVISTKEYNPNPTRGTHLYYVLVMEMPFVVPLFKDLQMGSVAKGWFKQQFDDDHSTK